jgi:hypothetical protein
VLVVAALFFALYSGGDWMDGYRWINMGIVPLCVLYADGVGALLGRLATRRKMWRITTAVLVGVPLLIYAVRSGHRILLPETTPYDVRRRVVYMMHTAERLHLDHVTQMEVDMGAQMWWSGFDLVDMAGLVDVPMAHHRWEKPFVRQYVYEHRKPEFAHVHGHWGNKTRMRSHAEWDQRYLEIPAVPTSRRGQHSGNHVRKDLFMSDGWEGAPEHTATFEQGPRLLGWQTLAPRVAPGQILYLELAWKRTRTQEDFRPVVFLASDQRVVTWEVPPAYDWVPIERWKRRDVFDGRHSLPLPADLEPGVYDLGFAILGQDGPHRPELFSATATTETPRFMEGEVRWSDAVEVAPLEDVEADAARGLEEAISLAEAGDCDGAERSWKKARRTLHRAHSWQRRANKEVRGPMARCYAAWAEAVGDRDGVSAMQQARRWDHRDPQVRRVADLLADDWVARGDALEAKGEDLAAFEVWQDALLVDPTRTWVRRRAEAARDRALALRAPKK